MEIRELTLRVTQSELNGWIDRLLHGDTRLRGVQAEITPGAVLIRGEYFLDRFGLAWIEFEADVEAGADGGFVGLRLADLRGVSVLGKLPLGSLRGQVLSKLTEGKEEWLRAENETLIIDVECLLQTKGVALAANLSGIRLETGALTLEAAVPEARTPPAP